MTNDDLIANFAASAAATDAPAETPKPKSKHTGRPPGSSGKNIKTKTLRRGRKLTQAETAEVVSLHLKGADCPTIAKTIDSHRSTVNAAIKRFAPIFKELENTEDYQTLRGKILTASELGLLKLLADPGKQRDASLNNAAYAFRQVHDARRLNEGLSTSNVASQVKFVREVLPDSDL